MAGVMEESTSGGGVWVVGMEEAAGEMRGGWMRSRWFQTAVSASVGAACTAFIATPLDVVKTRMQMHVCEGHETRCVPKDTLHFEGTLEGLIKIRRVEGIPALWRGLNATLLMVVPSTAAYFSMYDGIQKTIARKVDDRLSPYTPLLAGASARVVTSVAFGPVEMARTRILSGLEGQRTVAEVLMRLTKERGLRSLWTGLVPTLYRDAPFSAIYWLTYETLKNPDGKLGSRVKSEIALSLIAGTGAGTAAAAFTTPADVIKTRRQAVQLSESVGSVPRDNTFIGSIRLLLREEGMAGLLTGIGPRLAKVGPSCAIMMAAYELTRKYFMNITSTSS